MNSRWIYPNDWKYLCVLDADKNVYGQEILSIGIVLAVIGAVVMIVTFLGCFGALSLNKCCLLTVRVWCDGILVIFISILPFFV